MLISVRLSDQEPCQNKEKGKAICKELTDKYSRDNNQKQTWSVSLVGGLSENCRQTGTLQL